MVTDCGYIYICIMSVIGGLGMSRLKICHKCYEMSHCHHMGHLTLAANKNIKKKHKQDARSNVIL